jgi:hypothetical protein
MMTRRYDQEAKQRIADRRLREDEAPRLVEEAPRLATLQIDVENGTNRYLWRIVVERAPALFEIPCPEQGCENGGHDLTREIMRALRTSAPRVEGESSCRGDLGQRTCGRVLKYVATATYRE